MIYQQNRKSKRVQQTIRAESIVVLLARRHICKSVNTHLDHLGAPVVPMLTIMSHAGNGS